MPTPDPSAAREQRGRDEIDFITGRRTAPDPVPPRDPSAASSERCGMWVVVGGHESVCMKDPVHAGECLPNRSECMNMAEYWEGLAQSIYDAVTAIDTDGGWPFEGPSDERP